MSIALLPNVEALVSAFLRGRSEITALIDDRVYTVLPKGVVFPTLRLAQYDDALVTQRPLWVATSFLQLDAFGGTKADAYTLAATARAVMAAYLPGTHAGGVVTDVRFSGMRDEPDADYEPAKPRWLFTAEITVHPTK